MAGSIRTVIREKNLVVQDVSDFWNSVGARIGLQTIRVRGKLPDGRFCTSFGASQREAVNEWLKRRDLVRSL